MHNVVDASTLIDYLIRPEGEHFDRSLHVATVVGAASASLLTSAITSAIDESRHDQHFPQIGHILAGPLLVPQSWFAEAATYLYSLENARDLSEIGAQKISNILSALNFEVDDGVGATLPRYRELAKNINFQPISLLTSSLPSDEMQRCTPQTSLLGRQRTERALRGRKRQI